MEGNRPWRNVAGLLERTDPIVCGVHAGRERRTMSPRTDLAAIAREWWRRRGGRASAQIALGCPAGRSRRKPGIGKLGCRLRGAMQPRAVRGRPRRPLSRVIFPLRRLSAPAVRPRVGRLGSALGLTSSRCAIRAIRLAISIAMFHGARTPVAWIECTVVPTCAGSSRHARMPKRMKLGSLRSCGLLPVR